MNPIIKIENLSKMYRLGVIGTGTISHDLNRWWYKVRGKEDPYLKIGEANVSDNKSDSGYVWALKDINVEVMPGEVLGIIGKNGAGKSTLLKILSRVTGPTTGSISYRGRIGSLLEVGTGFHPELTGRENIFLNGAILGMTKSEIRRKFDEIVEFAGVERYIDTPVKRYSSGMKVRLGFAVAAHLEPEILVVDEVLAVGDAEFQKKAIGKMQDVSSKEGRTILFVSHNMASVNSLCTKGLVLENGLISFQGKIEDSIDQYLKDTKKKIKLRKKLFPVSNDLYGLAFIDVSLKESPNKKISIEIQIESINSLQNIGFGYRIKDKNEKVVGSYTPRVTGESVDIKRGKSIVILELNNFLNVVSGGQFYFDVWAAKPKLETIIRIDNVLSYFIEEKDLYNTGVLYETSKHGLIKVQGNISIIELA